MVQNLHVKLNADALVEACVELVSVNGRPLSLLEDTGFRKILDPILTAINKGSTEALIAINRKNIIAHIQRRAELLRKEIREEVAGRLVSLKTDTVTRMDRHLLGVNIQFIQDGQIRLRNLAIKEIFDSHTGENLKKELDEVLKEFGLTLSSVYSATTDNALNMLSGVEMMNADVVNTLLADDGMECSHTPYEVLEVSSPSPVSSFTDSEGSFHLETSMDEDSSSEASGMENDTDEEDNSEDEATPSKSSGKNSRSCPECTLIQKLFEEMGVHGVRCSAHTLQLAVEDAFKACRNYQPVLEKTRKLCKMLRIPSLRRELKKLGLNKISTEGATRWHSLFDMLMLLLKARPGCQVIQDMIHTKKIKSRTIKKKFRNLCDEEWKQIEEVCGTLAPARNATKVLQREQLTVGDFYRTWLNCKCAVEANDNDLAKALAEAMKTREKVLLSSPVFSAAIYMDPRFKVMLKDESVKTAAESHLQALWFRLHPISDSAEIQDGPVREEEVETEEENDPLELLLREAEKEQEASTHLSTASRRTSEITEHLKKIATWPRLPRNANILEFWEKKKHLEPELYELACVVMAVPMTQVSVERAFSHLRQVLSVLRYSLNSQLIKDIMLIRCNAYYEKNTA